MKELLEQTFAVVDAHLKKLGDIEPRFLLSLAHKKTNVLAVWWYSLSTGEIMLTTESGAKHSDDEFKEVAYKTNWLRGRAFRYNDQNVLLVYFPTTMRVNASQLSDIIDKLMNKLSIQFDYIISDEGQDISNLLESMSKEVVDRFSIKKLEREAQ